MKTYIYSLFTVLLLCTACDKDTDPTGSGKFPSDSKVRISAELEALQTKADPAPSAPYTGSSLSLNIDYGMGSPFTATHIKWSTADNGTSWTPANPMLWKDATTAAKVYAYAPAVEEATDIEAVPFTVAADQSAGLIPSDLLVYKDEAFVPASSLTTKQALNITFNHKLAKLVVNLKYGDQWGDTPPAVAKVAITGTKPTTTLNMKTEMITSAAGDPIAISPYKTTTTSGAVATYEAVVVPQTAATGTKLVSIELENGAVYTYTVSAAAGITLEAGKQHVITLRVGKDEVTLGSVTVADWGATVDWGNDDSELMISDTGFVSVLKQAPHYIPTISVGGKDVIDLTDPETIAAIEKVSELNVSYKNIKTLYGISHFVNLKKLRCSQNRLTKLDVSMLTNLEDLFCADNPISTLNVTQLVNLTSLTCYRNELSSLDLSSLKKLVYISCGFNRLSELNIAHLENMTELYCSDNNLTTLNIASLTKLTHLRCYNNKISDLDVTPFLKLSHLLCGEQTDLSGNSLILNLTLTQDQNKWFDTTHENNANVSKIVR